MIDIAIHKLDQLPPDALGELVAESEATGFHFVRRLIDEWLSGQNRFDRPGEAIFVASMGPRIIGVCGLNQDPYTTTPSVGRVRRLYVLADFRRCGVGRRLVEAVVKAAQGHFEQLRLRTENEAAARFFVALGFRSCLAEPECTHVSQLPFSLTW